MSGIRNEIRSLAAGGATEVEIAAAVGLEIGDVASVLAGSTFSADDLPTPEDNVDTHIKSGEASITGHDNVDTGLAGQITSVVCGMQTSDTDAGHGFSCSATPAEGDGQIAIVVRDVAGTEEATEPAGVFWFASDAT